MTVSSQTPINSYTYSGSSSFVYSFQLVNATDLLVTVNGSTKTLGVDYTVAGVGIQTGGSITYTSSLTTGDLVSLSRQTQLARSNDYQTQGDLLAATLNTDFDQLWRALQDRTVNDARTVRVPSGETTVTLPAAALRANKIVAFDSAGQPTVMVPVTGSAADVLTQIAASIRTNLMIAGNGPWANPASGDTQHLCEIINDRTPYQVLALSTYGLAGVVKENNIHCNRYGGSLAAPSAVQSGDYFMSWGYRGWDGTGVLSQSMAAFQYQATENWDSTHHGGRFKFELAKTGGSTTRLPAWKLYAGPTDGVVMEFGDETSLPSRILNASTTGFTQIHGSQDQGGAVVNLYGSAHATLARVAQVRADVISFQDTAGNEAVQVLATSQQVLFTGKGGFGYYQGAGTAVTQATNKSTNVAGDFPTIKVTMNAAALAASTSVSFSWNSSKIGADDHVVATIRGGATAGAYVAVVDTVQVGSARVSLRNMTGGSLSEAVVLQLSVLKGASA